MEGHRGGAVELAWRPRLRGAILAAAAGHGVERVVVISAATVEFPAGEPRFMAGFRALEAAAQSSGMAWTALRCSDFAANTLAWAPQLRAGDVVRGAYRDAATSPIHERDIAAVAVRALTEEGHGNRSDVLTGPRSLTQPDKVRILGPTTATVADLLDRPAQDFATWVTDHAAAFTR